MQVVYHPRYIEVYASEPAASPGRMEAILKELDGGYSFAEPQAATITLYWERILKPSWKGWLKQ